MSEWASLRRSPSRRAVVFFCTTVPVDQNAERIIFTQNNDGTVSADVQIEYTGSAPGFSWILLQPEAIDVEDVEVPEDAMAAFTELEVATDPVFIPPPLPECLTIAESAPAATMAPSAASVEVFASGEVGPYGFDVVGSSDPNALIGWLRDNSYRVTPEMEPLIDLYVEEGFVFLAMKLRPDQGVQDVEPVKITYPSSAPMIPLRLTAVAANPDMAVMVWIYADKQATPTNYAKIDIANEELIFFGRGGSNNYRQLMGDKADEYGGQGFITEYAAPTRELRVSHPLLRDLSSRHPYMTRLNTVISPEEMTVDPMFEYDPQLKDVSNVRDLSNMTGVYECDRQLRSEAVRPDQTTAPMAEANAGAVQEVTPDRTAASTGAVPEVTPDQTAANAGAVQEEPTQAPEQTPVILAEVDTDGGFPLWAIILISAAGGAAASAALLLVVTRRRVGRA